MKAMPFSESNFSGVSIYGVFVIIYFFYMITWPYFCFSSFYGCEVEN